MLSIQAVRGLPRLRAPGAVPCRAGSNHAADLYTAGNHAQHAESGVDEQPVGRAYSVHTYIERASVSDE